MIILRLISNKKCTTVLRRGGWSGINWRGTISPRIRDPVNGNGGSRQIGLFIGYRLLTGYWMHRFNGSIKVQEIRNGMKLECSMWDIISMGDVRDTRLGFFDKKQLLAQRWPRLDILRKMSWVKMCKEKRGWKTIERNRRKKRGLVQWWWCEWDRWWWGSQAGGWVGMGWGGWG